MSRPSRRSRTVAAVLALLLAGGGCSSLPEDGPVHTEQIDEQAPGEAPVDFTPGGPEPGAAPVEVVRGFLVAMQATPINTSVARRFLTAESSESWVPERGTTVYDSESRTVRGSDVRLDLRGTVRLDGRGRWLGRGGDRGYRMQMVQEDGQWRISDPPDRLFIPRAHFETRFAQHYLYYFDKTAQVLVPEPVYVPTGAQASTFLVAGLLAGPDRDLLGVVRTFLPARTRLDDISVPVTSEGTAVVPLSDEVLDVDEEDLAQAFAQLAWTLRQVPGIERMRVTVDGSPLDLPGVGADLAVDGWSELDPALSWASESLFGIRGGRVVTHVAGQERRVSGAFGSLDLAPRRVGVDPAGEQVAATTSTGSVLVAPRARVTGEVPTPRDVSTVYVGGSDVLAPVWDTHGQLWVLDRRPDGAVLTVLRPSRTGGDRSRQVDVVGITGEDVGSLMLSRDGTRLVATVSGAARDRILTARVQRDSTGRVRRVLPASRVRLAEGGALRVRDIGWRTPGTLAVLTAPASGASQVLAVKVDGSSTAAESTFGAEVFPGVARDVVTSPVLGAPLYIRTTGGRMFALAVDGRWTGAGIAAGLRSPTFVG